MIPNDVELEETRQEPINNDSDARGDAVISRTIGIRVNIKVTVSMEKNFQITYFSLSLGAVKSRRIVPEEISRTAISARAIVNMKNIKGRTVC